MLKESGAVRALESDVIEDLVFPSSVVDVFLGNSIHKFLTKFSSSIWEPFFVIDWFGAFAGTLASLLAFSFWGCVAFALLLAFLLEYYWWAPGTTSSSFWRSLDTRTP